MNVTELEKCIDMYGNDIYTFCMHLASDYSSRQAVEVLTDNILQ